MVGAEFHAGEAVYAFLIDPNGEPVSEKTNQSVTSGGTTDYASSIQFDHRSPQAGRWRMVFTVFGPIAGTSTSTGYSGQVRYGLADVAASGVPDSASMVLRRGIPVTARLHLVNRGTATDRFFVDARSTRRTTLLLVGRNATNYPMSPAPLAPFPAFVVPTETNSLTIKASSDRPVSFEASPFPADHVTDLSFEGDPDREAAPAGHSPAVTVSDPIVAAQTWLALPSQIGPFATMAPSSHTSFTGTAHTASFDTAVTASTGDPMLADVDHLPVAATPITVAPGAAGTITITLKPNAAPGSVVRGILYVDTYDSVTGSADEVAAVPYAYRVR